MQYNFTQIESEKNIDFGSSYKFLQARFFPETIVNELGYTVNSSSYQGHCFKLIQGEREYSLCERVLRGLLGILEIMKQCLCFSSNNDIEKLFTQEKEIKFFGIPFAPDTASASLRDVGKVSSAGQTIGNATASVGSNEQKLEDAKSGRIIREEAKKMPVHTTSQTDSKSLDIQDPSKIIENKTATIRKNSIEAIEKLITKYRSQKKPLDTAEERNRYIEEEKCRYRNEPDFLGDEGEKLLDELIVKIVKGKEDGNEMSKKGLIRAIAAILGTESSEYIDSILKLYYEEFPFLKDIHTVS